MSREKIPEDQPDAVVCSDDARTWIVVCTLCPRQLGHTWQDAPHARSAAVSHLEHAHGVVRVWVEQHRPGYQQAVQTALPLIVAHDLTLATDSRIR